MNDPKNDDQKMPDPISLSSALLAPINSIFEAQIHSARAFLNFILQMGFRHQPSKAELAEDEELKKADDLAKEKKARMKEIFKERERNGGVLPPELIAELKELNQEYGDLYHQSIEFIDQTGNEFSLAIPNLALLPIKPLAINEADFSYEFAVSTEKTTSYKQMGAALKKPDEEKERPWFLIKEPKSIKGNFATQKADSTDAVIQINVKVGNTEMPYGLEKLLVHLTNNMEVLDTKND